MQLFPRQSSRAAFATLSGRFNFGLFTQLMRFGLPRGIFAGLDTLAFSVYLLLVGQIGPVELNATSIAFTLDLIVVLPNFGLGQAVEVFVGQRHG